MIRGATLLLTVLFLRFPAVAGGCTDGDGDGFFREGGCGTAVDCADQNAAVFPGAVDICNGIDDNCNGVTEEDCTVVCETFDVESQGDSIDDPHRQSY